MPMVFELWVDVGVSSGVGEVRHQSRGLDTVQTEAFVVADEHIDRSPSIFASVHLFHFSPDGLEGDVWVNGSTKGAPRGRHSSLGLSSSPF